MHTCMLVSYVTHGREWRMECKLEELNPSSKTKCKSDVHLHRNSVNLLCEVLIGLYPNDQS